MKSSIKFEEYADNVLDSLIIFFGFLKGDDSECLELFNLAHAELAESIFPSSINKEDIARFVEHGIGISICSGNRSVIIDCDKIISMAYFLAMFSSDIVFNEESCREIIIDIAELHSGKLSRKERYEVIMESVKKYGKENNKKGESV